MRQHTPYRHATVCFFTAACFPQTSPFFQLLNLNATTLLQSFHFAISRLIWVCTYAQMTKSVIISLSILQSGVFQLHTELTCYSARQMLPKVDNIVSLQTLLIITEASDVYVHRHIIIASNVSMTKQPKESSRKDVSPMKSLFSLHLWPSGGPCYKSCLNSSHSPWSSALQRAFKTQTPDHRIITIVVSLSLSSAVSEMRLELDLQLSLSCASLHIDLQPLMPDKRRQLWLPKNITG